MAETAGSITFTVTRSGSSLPAGPSTRATANSSDYNGLVNLQVTFLANQTIAEVTVPIINDTVPESVDTFGFIVRSTYLAKTNWTIQDDDGSAGTTYSATPNANPVGEGAGTLSFTITRSGNLPAEILYASTVNGSANGYSGNVGDYTGTVNQQVSFAANQATAQVTISIANDATPENDETFGFVVQRNAADSVLTSLASTNWVIHDDDTGTIADYTVTPSARLVSAGQGPLTFMVTRTGTFLPEETVYASTVEGVNGYATNTGEWTNNIRFQPVNFQAGSTTATSTVSLALANVASAAAALKDFGFILQRSQDPNVSNHLAQTILPSKMTEQRAHHPVAVVRPY